MKLYTGGYLDVTPLLPAVTSKVHNNYNSSQSYPGICYTVLKSNPTYSSKDNPWYYYTYISSRGSSASYPSLVTSPSLN